jgi:hypothetical protein
MSVNNCFKYADRITTDPKEVLNIPASDLPLMCFSDNITSLFALFIRKHQHGHYSHFFWIIEPGKFVSQDLIFQEVPADNYLQGNHRLKFVRDRTWTEQNKLVIWSQLKSILSLPVYKRLYDFLQVFGHFIGASWLQIPGQSRICSDYGYVLKLTDSEYNLNHPTPTHINQFTKARRDRYEVYLRFIPD